MRTLRQLAVDEKEQFPEGSRILSNGVFMDDIFAGASTLDNAKLLIDICMEDGMHLRK